MSRWQVQGTFDRKALVSTTASQITSDEMIPNMAEDGQKSVVFELEDLPLLVPQRVGALQVVLLRQSVVNNESWELDYAAVGRITGELVAEARDEAGTEYVPAGGWSSGDAGLLVGGQTFTPGLGEGVTSVELLLSFEEPVSETTQGQQDQAPPAVAAHWAKRLQSQLAGWSQRDAVVEAVLAAHTRSEAVRRLSAVPFGFSEAEATHIIDMSLALLTGEGEAELQELLAAALSHVQDI